MWIDGNNPQLGNVPAPVSPQKLRRYPRECIVRSGIDLHRLWTDTQCRSGTVPDMPARLARDLLFPFSMAMAPINGIPFSMV